MNEKPTLEYCKADRKRWTRLSYADVMIRVFTVRGIGVMVAVVIVLVVELWSRNRS